MIESWRSLKRGDQVAYIPLHADGDLDHFDVQFGFVSSVNVKTRTVFVRYWRRDLEDLRTKANSEGCDPEFLIFYESVPQSQVEWAICRYVEGGDEC